MRQHSDFGKPRRKLSAETSASLVNLRAHLELGYPCLLPPPLDDF